MDSSYILLQLVLYYKVQHALLQISTDVTKSYDYYNWRKKRFNLNKFLSLSFKGKTYRKPAWYNWSHRTNFIHKTRHLSMWFDKIGTIPIESFMPQTATCYHNSLTLKRTVVHHVQELVFVPARTFDACVGLPLSSLHFFRLVSHALKVMMQSNVSQASRQARSCQTSFSGAELPCNYITRPPKGFRIETRRERSAGRKTFRFFQ